LFSLLGIWSESNLLCLETIISLVEESQWVTV
jgi:hypothetical protein